MLQRIGSMAQTPRGLSTGEARPHEPRSRRWLGAREYLTKSGSRPGRVLLVLDASSIAAAGREVRHHAERDRENSTRIRTGRAGDGGGAVRGRVGLGLAGLRTGGGGGAGVGDGGGAGGWGGGGVAGSWAGTWRRCGAGGGARGGPWGAGGGGLGGTAMGGGGGGWFLSGRGGWCGGGCGGGGGGGWPWRERAMQTVLRICRAGRGSDFDERPDRGRERRPAGADRRHWIHDLSPGGPRRLARVNMRRDPPRIME